MSAGQEAAQEVFRLYQQKQFAEAETAAREALAHFPRNGFIWKVLGVACAAQGRNAEALQAKQRAVELLPNDAEALANLANALAGAGRYKQAAQSRARICALRPGEASLFNDWGNALRDAQDMPAAQSAYEQALALDPRMAESLANLANTLVDLGRPCEAERRYREALALQPARGEIHSNFGNLLKSQGRHAEALACYREAMRLLPQFAGAHTNYLLGLNHVPGIAPQTVKAEAITYGRWADSKVRTRPALALRSPGDIVRVGFVTGDLRRHPVGYFLESTLQHWPRDRVSLVAYATSALEDGLTSRVKPCFDRWRMVQSMSDEQLAQVIALDGIDVLVDLAGHTALNRLPLFAWRPARVQATWLGYFATTGVAQMDWLLTDDASIRPEEEADFTERIWRLPGTRLCFSPPEEAVEVSELPARRNGFITFGSFQNLGKTNDEVLALWSRVLREVPRSRLRLQNVQVGEPEMQEIFVARLAAAGIPAERVALHGRMNRLGYLRAHGEVDIVLDTFPYPGGTTTCEALWMGVPTITLAGTSLLSRQGESLLAAAGTSDWIGRTPDDYVAKAVALAGSIDRLAEIRAGLRERVASSGLFDAPRFARELADAFVAMASGEH